MKNFKPCMCQGRLGWIQYIPLKRARFGIKHFLLCESSTGYVWCFVLYVGKGTQFDPEFDDLANISTKIVMSLIKPLLKKGYCLTIDNYYTSPQLADLLISNLTDLYGTVRSNRKDLPDGLSKEKLRKGEVTAFRRGKLMAMRWKDKKDVYLLSSIHNAEQQDVETRKGTVQKPKVVCDYNLSMGGVDKSDQMLSCYPIPRKRTKKYYKKMFFHMLDIAVWNTYILYEKSGKGKKTLSPLNYRVNLVRALIEKYRSDLPPSSAGRPSNFPQPTRFSGSHFMELIPPSDKKAAPTRRCIVCARKRDSKGKKVRKESRYQCKLCKESLCVVPCFEKYHCM